MGQVNAHTKEKKGTAGAEQGGADDEPQAGNGKPKNKKKGGGEGNKPVVLRVDLHCDGCARKVKKAIKAAQGVEGVATDMAASTVTVSGKPDPWELKDRIESRTHKAVAFVAPPNPPKNKKDDSTAVDGKKTAAAAAAGKGNSDGKSKTTDDKKNNEPPESTVVVKIRLHCDGCIDRIKRTAHKIKGVKQVTVDTSKEHVTVTGTMDAKALPDVLRDKLKREVAVVPPAKKVDGSDGDKKKNKQQQQQQGGDGDKDGGQQQASGGGGGGGGKKKKKKKQQDGEEEEEEEEGGAAGGSMLAAAVATMYGGGSSTYRVEMLHAPQLFSDENPNACAVM